jgi:hypothetical protein
MFMCFFTKEHCIHFTLCVAHRFHIFEWTHATHFIIFYGGPFWGWRWATMVSLPSIMPWNFVHTSFYVEVFTQAFVHALVYHLEQVQELFLLCSVTT